MKQIFASMKHKILFLISINIYNEIKSDMCNANFSTINDFIEFGSVAIHSHI